MAVKTKIQFRRDTAANWTSVNPTLASGEMGIETDTNKFKLGDGSTAWSSLSYGGIQGVQGTTGTQGVQGTAGAQGATGTVPSAYAVTWKKTASGGETSLSGNDDNSVSLSYTVGQEMLYQNGVLLVRGADYTATTGTSIALSNALTAADIIAIWCPTAFNVANTYTSAQVDSLLAGSDQSILASQVFG